MLEATGHHTNSVVKQKSEQQ